MPRSRVQTMSVMLLLPEVRLDDATCIIDRIREGFPPAVLGHGELELPCTFSAGVTEALPDDDRSSILRRADRALYAAKEEGRNRTKRSVSKESAEDADRHVATEVMQPITSPFQMRKCVQQA
jgi:hypothetical protein